MEVMSVQGGIVLILAVLTALLLSGLLSSWGLSGGKGVL